jgi:hypothetical protein
MQLVACVPPADTLVPAPLSALCETRAPNGVTWAGFWSSDGDVYFARCRNTSGDDEWYRLVDSPQIRASDPVAADAAIMPQERQAHGRAPTSAPHSVTVMVMRTTAHSRTRRRDAVILRHRSPG